MSPSTPNGWGQAREHQPTRPLLEVSIRPLSSLYPTSSLSDFRQLHPFLSVLPASSGSSNLRFSGVFLGFPWAWLKLTCPWSALSALAIGCSGQPSGFLFLNPHSCLSTARLLVTLPLHKSLLRKVPDKSNPRDKRHASQEYLPLERKRRCRGSRVPGW